MVFNSYKQKRTIFLGFYKKLQKEKDSLTYKATGKRKKLRIHSLTERKTLPFSYGYASFPIALNSPLFLHFSSGVFAREKSGGFGERGERKSSPLLERKRNRP